jgi:hypothetical protein
MDANTILRAFQNDKMSRFSVGGRITGTSTNSDVAVFSENIDISKHGKISVAFANTDAANGIAYTIQVSGNPNDTTPVWVTLDDGVLASGVSKVVEKGAVGLALKILIKSAVSGSAATFETFYRLNPY